MKKADPPMGIIGFPIADPWDIGPKYLFQRELGNGTYGAVCETVVAGTNVRCAIKKFTNIFRDALMCKRVLREIEILYKLVHPCIVRPIDFFVKQESDVYLVMEVAQMDLRKLIRSPVYLLERQVKVILYKILLAVNYMHSAGIIHRDIKPANILLNSDCTVKVCDFSLSRSMEGLKASLFDCDRAIRGNPLLCGSGSCTSNLPSFPSFKETQGDWIEGDTEEGLDNQKKKTVHCDFQVKFQKDDVILETSCPYVPDEGEEGSPITIDEPKNVESGLTLSEKKIEQRKILLSKSKEVTPCLQRELTGHVATRWYRAPELILVEKVYTLAVDIWSVGCVFAELLQTIKEVEPDYNKRRPLFPGSSCYPLSPSHRPTINITEHPISPYEQINLIFKTLGNPGKMDLTFLNDQRAEEYVKGFPKYRKQDLVKMFRAADPDAIDLLEKMLVFNPYYRITAKEALRHRYFADIRDKTQEIEAEDLIPLTTDSCKYSSLDALAREVLSSLFGK